MRPTFATFQIGRAIDERSLQIAVVAAAVVLHVFERGLQIPGCVEPRRGFAALLAFAPIVLERGAWGGEADGPEIAVAQACANRAIAAAVVIAAVAGFRPALLTPVAGPCRRIGAARSRL